MEHDKSYWNQYYSLKYRVFKKDKISKAKQEIQEFLKYNPKSYVALSGGKDSVVVLHLALSVDPNIQVMTHKDDFDFPESLGYVKNLSKILSFKLDILQPPVNLWSIISQIDIVDDIHSKGTELSDRYFYSMIKEYKKENGFTGAFLGLRAEESRARRLNRIMKGVSYYNKSMDQSICQPIVDWKAWEVLAYIHGNNIPLHPVYYKTMFKASPEEIREGWMLPGSRANQGQVQWLKYYYPDHFYKLAKVKPELLYYV